MYVIESTAKPYEYWSNECGWVGIESADRFTNKQKETLRLPMEGAWKPLWETDPIQFARLISECYKTCMFQEGEVAYIAKSMNLYPEDVYWLIERAQIVWNNALKLIPKTPV